MSPRLPAITAARLLRVLLRSGFVIHHQKGSHATLKNPEKPELRVTIPIHSGDLPRGTVRSILIQADMTEEDLLRDL